ncbi:MAG: hypothetical protein WBY47_17135, partial [Desulfobacterales bacterium]
RLINKNRQAVDFCYPFAAKGDAGDVQFQKLSFFNFHEPSRKKTIHHRGTIRSNIRWKTATLGRPLRSEDGRRRTDSFWILPTKRFRFADHTTKHASNFHTLSFLTSSLLLLSSVLRHLPSFVHRHSAAVVHRPSPFDLCLSVWVCG